MRVYCEDQLMDNLVGSNDSYYVDYVPSAVRDAHKCKQDIEEKKITPSTHRTKSFHALIDFLVDGLQEGGDYEIQGPVLKPLQSLFNKMFIRRGQTSVSVIGDMTRATLLLKDENDLKRIVSRIETLFPSINGNEFQGPNKIGVATFLEEVAKIDKVPGTEIILYRLKPNSSQKERMSNKKDPLYFNLNFFDSIPEYHRVGTTEMFVAFELQIGLESEIKGLREDHVSYEEGRILNAQPLLKAYKEAQVTSNEVNSSTTSAPSSLIEMSENQDDFKLITAVLEGNFSNCRYRALDQREIDGEGRDLIAPTRLCLNNKRLNIWAHQDKAVILDGPFELDPSLRYSVDLMSFRVDLIEEISVGLFAYFGPYVVQISALFLGYHHAEEISLIKPGVNFLTMESISMLPPQCDGVVIVAWGHPYDNMMEEECMEEDDGVEEDDTEEEEDMKEEEEDYAKEEDDGFLTMESISVLPPHCDDAVIVAWGEPYDDMEGEEETEEDDMEEEEDTEEEDDIEDKSVTWLGNALIKGEYATWLEVKESYHGMKLVLDQYEELPE